MRKRILLLSLGFLLSSCARPAVAWPPDGRRVRVASAGELRAALRSQAGTDTVIVELVNSFALDRQIHCDKIPRVVLLGKGHRIDLQKTDLRPEKGWNGLYFEKMQELSISDLHFAGTRQGMGAVLKARGYQERGQQLGPRLDVDNCTWTDCADGSCILCGGFVDTYITRCRFTRSSISKRQEHLPHCVYFTGQNLYLADCDAIEPGRPAFSIRGYEAHGQPYVPLGDITILRCRIVGPAERSCSGFTISAGLPRTLRLEHCIFEGETINPVIIVRAALAARRPVTIDYNRYPTAVGQGRWFSLIDEKRKVTLKEWQERCGYDRHCVLGTGAKGD